MNEEKKDGTCREAKAERREKKRKVKVIIFLPPFLPTPIITIDKAVKLTHFLSRVY